MNQEQNETNNTVDENSTEEINNHDESYSVLNDMVSDIAEAAKVVGKTLGSSSKKVLSKIGEEIHNYREEQERKRLEKERLQREEEERLEQERQRLEEKRRLQRQIELEAERKRLAKNDFLSSFGFADMYDGDVEDIIYPLLRKMAGSKNGELVAIPEDATVELLLKEHLRYDQAIFIQNNMILKLLDSIEKNTSQEAHDEQLLEAIRNLQYSIDNIDLTPEVTFDDERILESNRELIEAIKNIDAGYDDSDVLYELGQMRSMMDSGNNNDDY